MDPLSITIQLESPTDHTQHHVVELIVAVQVIVIDGCIHLVIIPLNLAGTLRNQCESARESRIIWKLQELFDLRQEACRSVSKVFVLEDAVPIIAISFAQFFMFRCRCGGYYLQFVLGYFWGLILCSKWCVGDVLKRLECIYKMFRWDFVSIICLLACIKLNWDKEAYIQGFSTWFSTPP